MIKCFVEPDVAARGVQCDPKAPACRDWRWNDNEQITLDNYQGIEDACCGNCYFSHEVES